MKSLILHKKRDEKLTGLFSLPYLREEFSFPGKAANKLYPYMEPNSTRKERNERKENIRTFTDKVQRIIANYLQY